VHKFISEPLYLRDLKPYKQYINQTPGVRELITRMLPVGLLKGQKQIVTNNKCTGDVQGTELNRSAALVNSALETLLVSYSLFSSMLKPAGDGG